MDRLSDLMHSARQPLRFIHFIHHSTPAQDRARSFLIAGGDSSKILSFNAHETKSRHAWKHDD